jgi:opacity protein-like surface antigen
MKASTVLVPALALGLCAVPAAAQERASGFWAGVDLGYGSLRRDLSVSGPQSENKVAMGFRGGYFWHPQLLLGLELGGWNMEAANWDDPATGEGITTLFLIAQYYPLAGSAGFVKGGLGAVDYWNNRPSESGATGPGGMLGAGWDFRMGASSFYITPSVDYSWGRFGAATSPPGVTQDQRYRAVTFRVGLTYR